MQRPWVCEAPSSRAIEARAHDVHDEIPFAHHTCNGASFRAPATAVFAVGNNMLPPCFAVDGSRGKSSGGGICMRLVTQRRLACERMVEPLSHVHMHRRHHYTYQPTDHPRHL